MSVAIDQNHAFKPFSRPPRCKLPSYSQLDYTMLESTQTNLTQPIKDAPELKSLHRSLSTPCLSVNSRLGQESNSSSRIEIIGGNRAPRVGALVVEVAIAMASGIDPEPVSTGLGGAYFLKSQNGDIIAVAKPIDEEPLAFNNPKGFAGRLLGQPGMKRSIMVGETGPRELAAYLLDHGGFAGVPPTALVKVSNAKFNLNSPEAFTAPPRKVASLQRFVDHDSDAGDLGPSGFSVSSIHRIGILDVRLLNLDRHAGNLLVKKGEASYSMGTAELVPIDHGFCLPESLDDPYFEWLHWPQAMIPFSESEIDYISSLDPFKDAETIRTELPSIRESAIRVFVLCSIFLKQAAESGMCLAEIGEMMTRNFQGGEENWSALENLCLNAKAGLSSRMSDDSSSCNQVEEDIDDVFQFDEDTYNRSSLVSDIFPVSQGSLISGELPNMARFLSEKSIAKLGESEFFPLEGDDSHPALRDLSEDTVDESKVVSLMRSMSFAVPNRSPDSAGISFGEMTSQEWESFLDRFKQLLPEFFEARKGMCMPKQRLGNSCEF